MVMNHLSCYLPGTILFSTSFLKYSFSEWNMLGWQFFLSAFWIYHLLSLVPQGFRWEICWYPYGCFLVCEEFFFSSFFQNSFFVSDFRQFYYNMYWRSFGLKFGRELELHEFGYPNLSPDLGSSQPFSLNKLSTPFSLSSPSRTSIMHTLFCFMVSHRSHRLSSLFFIVSLLTFGYFKWSDFTDSAWSRLLLTLSTAFFHFILCILQSQSLFCSFFHYFCHSVKLPIFFMYCFPDFI